MFLKHLINPKPSILLIFASFSLIFVTIPLIKFDLEVVFFHAFFPSLIVLFLSLIIPFFLSIGLNNLTYEKNIIKKENILIAWVFILTSTPFVNNVELWIASFAVLFMTNLLFSSYQKDQPFSYIYNASFIIALVSFFFPSQIMLLLLLLINAINYSHFSWRILLIITLGFITPYLLFFIFSFLTNVTFIETNFFNLNTISFSKINILHPSKKIWLFVLFIVICFSFKEIFSWLYKKSIKSRKTFKTLIWFFLISVINSVLYGVEHLYFSILPLSIIVANYFVYSKKRRLANVLFCLFLITSLYYRYMIVY
tara:strand:+ start:19138 stop:20070 length:933 start_codon:yes stop_codon:yes gene_type:complete